MRIGVIGNGVVGHATARCFMEFTEVRVYDKIAERRTHSLNEVLECDLVFVCVPEAFIESVAATVEASKPLTNLVIKSTVPIGTTRHLAERYVLPNLVHSPEFLTARCAVTDAQLPARNIIGSPVTPDRLWDDAPVGSRAILADLYKRRFPGVPFFVMTSDESEAVKLIQNGFFAVKIAFFNEINTLCEEWNLDWERVRAAILADGRIAHSHTQVPGPDGKYGFGGTCLPKDLKQLIECAEAMGGASRFLSMVYEQNKLIRLKQGDNL